MPRAIWALALKTSGALAFFAGLIRLIYIYMKPSEYEIISNIISYHIISYHIISYHIKLYSKIIKSKHKFYFVGPY